MRNYLQTTTSAQIEQARQLFREYPRHEGFSSCFQEFDQYESLSFLPIALYRDKPVGGALRMELTLDSRKSCMDAPIRGVGLRQRIMRSYA